MKKVILIHGFGGTPNGAWRSWVMAELDKENVYAYALSMPTPEAPVLEEWLQEVVREMERSVDDEIYLVGHSLGATTILRYLESPDSKRIAGAILVSGPIVKTKNNKIDNFLDRPFDFEAIKEKVGSFVVIHGDNDERVPLADHAEILSRELGAELIVIPNGQHLNGAAGFIELPECLRALRTMMQ